MSITAWTLLLHLSLFLLRTEGQILINGNSSKYPNNGICDSIDVRNDAAELEALRNCTVIVGFLQIVLIEHYDNISLNLSYPELREVTQFVIFYKAENIVSLGQLFPNLTLIRGRKLVRNYALVIYDLSRATEIGLKSLITIQRGYVRIANNEKLCYTTTIDWERITGKLHQNENYIHSNGGTACPTSGSCRGCTDDLCWSSKHCQRIPLDDCHPECMGGCWPNKTSCYSCKNYVNDGICVPSCPDDKIEFEGANMCITEDLCKSMYRGNGWTWNKRCIRKCPKDSKMVVKDGVKSCEYCGNMCNVTCRGAEIETLEDAQSFKGCNYINGSLFIKFAAPNKHSEDVMQELTDNLQDIKEISGILKIYRSPAITSLTFFKNLTVIHGEELMYDRYSFIVHEMPNLHSLWNFTTLKNFTLKKGIMSFHFNPKLCLETIQKLANLANVSLADHGVTRESNGYESHCNFIPLSASHIVIDPYTATITWDRLKYSLNKDPELGYYIYYFEEEEGVTYSSIDTCYDKGWEIKYIPDPKDSIDPTISYNLTGLKPYTDYVYYVESYYKSMNISKKFRDGQSAIQRFQTEMDEPRMPIGIEAFALNYDTISVTWLDDYSYNGIIKHHMIEAVLQTESLEQLDVRNYCLHPPVRTIDETYNVQQKHSNQIDQESFSTATEAPSSRERCSCSMEEWDKFIHDKIGFNASAKHGIDMKSWCKYDSKKVTYEKGADVLRLYHCKLYYSDLLDEEPENISSSEIHSRLERSMSDFELHKVVGKPTSKSPTQNVTVNDVRHSYSTKIFGDHRNFTFDNLKHYGKYMIYVQACKTSGDDDCGGYAFTAGRTKPKPAADLIEEINVVVLTQNTVEVHWEEPKDPNGAILHYTLVYGLVDQNDESKHKIHCITRKEHETNDGKHKLILKSGKYWVKVKAHSLAIDGEFTRPYYFSTVTLIAYWWIVFLVLFLVILTAIGVVWFWRKRKLRVRERDDIALLPTAMISLENIAEDDPEEEFFDTSL